MNTIGSTVTISLVVMAGAVGQILMKMSVNSVSLKMLDSNPRGGAFFFIGQLLLTPTVWVALPMYAVGLLVWMLALRSVSLNFAYSFQALTYLLVPIGSIWLLGESVSLLRWGGIIVICLGICIVAVSQ